MYIVFINHLQDNMNFSCSFTINSCLPFLNIDLLICCINFCKPQKFVYPGCNFVINNCFSTMFNSEITNSILYSNNDYYFKLFSMCKL